jgi:hypothetical protein
MEGTPFFLPAVFGFVFSCKDKWFTFILTKIFFFMAHSILEETSFLLRAFFFAF